LTCTLVGAWAFGVRRLLRFRSAHQLAARRPWSCDPQPRYPGPGPQPGSPGVRSVLCVHWAQIVRESERIGRHGRSGCRRGCCHDWAQV